MPSTRDANHSVAGSTSKTNANRSFAWLSVSILTAAGFAARLYCLTCKPFWFDETFSVEVARVTWGNFLHLLWWREANMSLYYALLRLWLYLGQSPFFIRTLSAIIATATIPAVYWLARILYDRRIALIAAALTAFNAYDVRYAQEARSYALFLLLTILSSCFLIRFLRAPNRRNRTAYILLTTLAVYSHLYALLLLVAQFLAVRTASIPEAFSAEEHPVSWQVLQAEMRRSWTIIGIAVAPLLVFVAKTGAGPIRWIHRPGIRDLWAFIEHLAGSDSWQLATLYGLAVIAAVLGLGNVIRRRAQTWEVWRCQFLLIWLLFPVVLTVVLSFARPVFLSRYLIFVLPALLILVASGIQRLLRGWLLAPAMAIILLAEAQGTAFIYTHDFDEERDASVAAASFILDDSQPGDAVIFHIAETRIPYEYVRSMRSGQNTASPKFREKLGPEIIFPNHGAGLGYKDFTGKPTADSLRSSLPSHPRVWVMLMNNGTAEEPDPTTVMLTQVLPEMFPRVERWQFTKVEVRLYNRQR
ncbi:MAG TPA: glycosyltransferase family 39 protein [Candidatus Sulfotelmatobacter sp.]|nr:glycosyltransferase family 39 protein [Candidatus Sulfotelmatobacter sp.]